MKIDHCIFPEGLLYDLDNFVWMKEETPEYKPSNSIRKFTLGICLRKIYLRKIFLRKIYLPRKFSKDKFSSEIGSQQFAPQIVLFGSQKHLKNRPQKNLKVLSLRKILPPHRYIGGNQHYMWETFFF